MCHADAMPKKNTVIVKDMSCPVTKVPQEMQVVETGAALTWAFFAFPTQHLDEKTPLLQVCLLQL